MGKGNYRGTPSEMIMYFLTTDYNVDVDVGEFKVVEKTKKESRKAGQISESVVTWKNYSFKLRTGHYNINILAEDIINRLSNPEVDSFRYTPKGDTPLRMAAWDVLGEKFGRERVDVGKTWYYPATNEYKLEVKLLNRPLYYSHKGDLPKMGNYSREIGLYFMETYPEYLL